MKNALLFRAVCGAALAALGLSTPAVSRAQTTYTLTNLGSLGGTYSSANSLNNNGQVVGFSSTAGDADYHAFLYDGAAMKDIDPGSAHQTSSAPGGSRAASINNRGQIVGFYVPTSPPGSNSTAINSTVTDQGFLYQNGAAVSIVYPGAYATLPTHINDNGAVVGSYSPKGNYDNQPFLYAQGAIQKVSGVTGGYVLANGINNAGQIVGSSGQSVDGPYRGYIAANNAVTTFTNASAYRILPSAINDNGQIVGSFIYTTQFGSDGHSDAFIYQNGTFTDLGALGGRSAAAYAINASGAIVGVVYAANNQAHAFLYQNGAAIDLNTVLPAGSGWQLSNATGINDSGQICGTGLYNGQSRAFLLTPKLRAVTVIGQIGLEGVGDFTQISPGAPLGTFHVGFRAPNTTTDIYGADVALTTTPDSQFATFVVRDIPIGFYDVTIKGAKNLRVVLPTSIGSDPTVLTPITLPGGDANNDNSVDSTDFGILIGAYGSSAAVPGSGYDPTADFNFDGSIDSTDFGILISEFDTVGAP